MITSTRSLLIGVALGAVLTGCAATGGRGTGAPGSGTPSGASTGSPPAEAAPASPDAGTAGGVAGRTGPAAERGGGTADPGVPAKTPAERRADIDSKLDSSLGGFDEQLRREQQRTASERDARATARADGAAVDEADAADGEPGAGKRDSNDIRRDRAGDLRSEGVDDRAGDAPAVEVDPEARTANSGNVTGGGGGKVARPIPSAEGDDIVARRLRRAAENETDPELKEKLWDEYRDYKENTKGST